MNPALKFLIFVLKKILHAFVLLLAGITLGIIFIFALYLFDKTVGLSYVAIPENPRGPGYLLMLGLMAFLLMNLWISLASLVIARFSGHRVAQITVGPLEYNRYASGWKSRFNIRATAFPLRVHINMVSTGDALRSHLRFLIGHLATYAIGACAIYIANITSLPYSVRAIAWFFFAFATVNIIYNIIPCNIGGHPSIGMQFLRALHKGDSAKRYRAFFTLYQEISNGTRARNFNTENIELLLAADINNPDRWQGEYFACLKELSKENMEQAKVHLDYLLEHPLKSNKPALIAAHWLAIFWFVRNGDACTAENHLQNIPGKYIIGHAGHVLNAELDFARGNMDAAQEHYLAAKTLFDKGDYPEQNKEGIEADLSRLEKLLGRQEARLQ